MITELSVIGLTAAVTYSITTYANTHIPLPHMDEIFHIRQTQTYCAGNWTVWDPKITTLPGAYLPAVAASSLSLLSCANGLHLRFLSLLMGILNLGIVTYVSSSLATGLVVYAIPIHVFYTTLYYTDLFSLASILLLLAFSSRGFHLLAALLGVLSVLVRQNNILWVLFAGGSATLALLLRPSNTPKSPTRQAPSSSLLVDVSTVARSLLTRNPISWLPTAGPYLAVVLGFAVFFVLNDYSVVVGDRSAHALVFHGANACYALAFVFLFGAIEADLTSPRPALLAVFDGGVLQGLVCLALVAGGCVYAVLHGTFVHPYLLADNSHVPFYLWSKYLSRGTAYRLGLVPLYTYAALAIYFAFARVNKRMEGLLWFAATAGATVPAGLIEPRYFLVSLATFKILTTPAGSGFTLRAGLSLVRDVVVSGAMFYVFFHTVRGVHIMW